jgi:dienelactone hydrolase
VSGKLVIRVALRGGEEAMGTITTTDGTEIFYKDSGTGQPIVFSHGWKKITVPVLVMHGDDDQIVPYADSGPLSAKLVQNGTLKTYSGFPHGMPTTEAETINADLLAFVKT